MNLINTRTTPVDFYVVADSDGNTLEDKHGHTRFDHPDDAWRAARDVVRRWPDFDIGTIYGVVVRGEGEARVEIPVPLIRFYRDGAPVPRGSTQRVRFEAVDFRHLYLEEHLS